MKKMLIPFILLSIMYSSFGQSLLDNADYKKALEYKALYEKAMEDGEYDKASEYAGLSSEHSAKSDEYVNMMLLRFRSNQSLKRLHDRLIEVKRFGGDRSDPVKYAEAAAGYETSGRLYKDADYGASLEASKAAIGILEAFERPVPVSGLVSEYVVRLIPGNRDCLWKIAGYSFIYGDPTLWRLIYDANKSIMPQKDNPDLILPGMVLKIPAKGNEKREGRWKNGAIE